MNPTIHQHQFLTNAIARPDSRLCKPHAVENRMWMTHLVQMDGKGYIRWEGPRAFISTAGRAAIQEQPHLGYRVAKEDKRHPALPLIHQGYYSGSVEHPN